MKHGDVANVLTTLTDEVAPEALARVRLALGRASLEEDVSMYAAIGDRILRLEAEIAELERSIG